MKIENKKKLNTQKINCTNILEIILLLYCIVLFKNYIPREIIEVLNYSISVKAINNYIIYKNIEDNINFKAKVKSSIVDSKKSLNFENELVVFNSLNLNSVLCNFETFEKIQVLEKYIKDGLFLIIYYIYSKSRKKSNGVKFKYSKLCIN